LASYSIKLKIPPAHVESKLSRSKNRYTHFAYFHDSQKHINFEQVHNV